MVRQQGSRSAVGIPLGALAVAIAIFWFTDWPDGLVGPLSLRAKVMITAGFGLVCGVVLYAFGRREPD